MHDHVATGQDDSKFGFTLPSGAAHEAIERAQRARSMDLVGLHCQIGSNMRRVASFAEASHVMVELCAPLELPELTLADARQDPQRNGLSRAAAPRGAYARPPSRGSSRPSTDVRRAPGDARVRPLRRSVAGA